jgi:hypothetical protein
MKRLDELIEEHEKQQKKWTLYEMEKAAMGYAVDLVIADIEAHGGIDANTENLITEYRLNFAERKSRLE